MKRTALTMSPSQLDRYRALLGVDAEPPGHDALRRLVRAQLCRVPFENLTKILHLKREGREGVPDADTYLDGIEHWKLGGTCYAANGYFNLLLRSTGYDAMLCGADMDTPDAHLVNVVELQGERFLVDVGFAAPFYEPLPLSGEGEQEIRLGNERYELSPHAAEGYAHVRHFRDDSPRESYTVRIRPRRFEEFAEPIAQSFRSDATFLNTLVLVRYYPDRALSVRGSSFIEAQGMRVHERKLETDDERAAVLTGTFGIPDWIVRDVLDWLERNRH